MINNPALALAVVDHDRGEPARLLAALGDPANTDIMPYWDAETPALLHVVAFRDGRWVGRISVPLTDTWEIAQHMLTPAA